jgi:hypothetical protein
MQINVLHVNSIQQSWNAFLEIKYWIVPWFHTVKHFPSISKDLTLMNKNHYCKLQNIIMSFVFFLLSDSLASAFSCHKRINLFWYSQHYTQVVGRWHSMLKFLNKLLWNSQWREEQDRKHTKRINKMNFEKYIKK